MLLSKIEIFRFEMVFPDKFCKILLIIIDKKSIVIRRLPVFDNSNQPVLILEQ